MRKTRGFRAESSVEEAIEVDGTVSTAYNQWTQFEEFPRFMGGVESVRQLDDKTLHWIASIAGVTREAVERMGIQSVKNILSVFDGQPIRENVVNPEALG